MRSAGVAIGAVIAITASLIGAPPVVAATEPITASATLEKTASVTTVGPGETFTYGIQVGCSSITDTGCKDAVLTDVVPAPFVVVSAVVGPGANTALDPTVSGNNVTVNWSTDLGDGRIGLLDGTTAIVTITAQLPADASADVDGIPVLNNASLDGANFEIAQDQVPVTPLIPLQLETTAAKSITPDQALASPGAPVSATISGTGTSNGSVETLTLTDPADPDAADNPFELLPFVSFGAVTSPAGSATTYRVYVAGIYTYSIAAPETLALLLAHSSRATTAEDLMLGALSHPRNADALPALAGAVAGAAFGIEWVPDDIRTSPVVLDGVCIQELAGATLDDIIQRIVETR